MYLVMILFSVKFNSSCLLFLLLFSRLYCSYLAFCSLAALESYPDSHLMSGIKDISAQLIISYSCCSFIVNSFSFLDLDFFRVLRVMIGVK